MSPIDLLNRTQATRDELVELLRGTEELRQQLDSENKRLTVQLDELKKFVADNRHNFH